VTLAFAPSKLSLGRRLLFALVQIGKRFARARRVMASELAAEGVTLAFAPSKLSLGRRLLFALVQIGKRFARARRV
ncbi:hypothetical protein C0U44_31660, partial [Klebsiella pneumoniae]